MSGLVKLACRDGRHSSLLRLLSSAPAERRQARLSSAESRDGDLGAAPDPPTSHQRERFLLHYGAMAKAQSTFRDYFEALLIAGIFLGFSNTFLVKTFYIPSASNWLYTR